MFPDGTGWVLLLVQLPASPSSARVSLWRRLRQLGAVSVNSGTWMLPWAEDHARLFDEIARDVRAKTTGAALVMHATGDDAVDADIVAKFREHRAREYHELAVRCDGLLEEIAEETRRGKLSFAELEEVEADAANLEQWLAKITARDFFPDERAGVVAHHVEQCREAVAHFAATVFEHEDRPPDSPRRSRKVGER